MDKKQITQQIEKYAPLQLAEEWDCSGWIVDTLNNNVNKVMLCLTVTDDIIRQAKDNGCDMIISHHPLFFVPYNYKNIDIYCAHTNMDVASGGTTDTLIENLGFQTSENNHPFVRIVDINITLEDLICKLRLVSPNLRYVNNKHIKNLKKVAFCAGSGSSFIEETDCDAYVTGDLKFHTAIESNKVLIDIGHFESEILILRRFGEILKDYIEVQYAEEKSPFLY